MLKTAIRAVILSATLAMATTAVAETINLRQLNQQRNIDAGVRSCKLTPAEARMLRREQHDITNAKKRFKAMDGGKITPRHEARVHAMQDAADRNIGRLKRNGRHC